jgi:hypothetical protein
MDDMEKKLQPGKARKALAACIAVLCIVVTVLENKLSTRLNMCACLLFSWDIAFTPKPSLRTPLREVYNMARQGWRTPLSSKLVGLAAMVLVVAGQYFAFHGR